LKAAIAHLWFVTLHPFDDGNGRIARAVADMQLARADKSPLRFYSMSAQISIERKNIMTYLKRLKKTRWISPNGYYGFFHAFIGL
jgi:Fic family protein